MEELEEEAKAKKNMMWSKKHARLHGPFLRFSKALKKLKLHGHGHASPNNKSSSPASSASFLSACMHPRTRSFASGRRRRQVVAAAARDEDDDDDDVLAVNFRSLRIGPSVVVASDDGSSTQDHGGCESEDDDVAAAAAKATAGGIGGGVAVVTFSVAPYEDFRRSMREMVDARREAVAGAAPPPAVDWDFMEELLFFYLQLNDRLVHKDILRAFTDTVATLRRRRRAPAAKSRRTRRQRRARHDVEEAVASS